MKKGWYVHPLGLAGLPVSSLCQQSLYPPAQEFIMCADCQGLSLPLFLSQRGTKGFQEGFYPSFLSLMGQENTDCSLSSE